MPKVKLKGLNIRRNGSGTWYASLRATGKLLARAPSREALDQILAGPDFLHAYASAERKRRRTHAFGTLGALVEHYKTKPRWTKLAERTKADYGKVLAYLDPLLDDIAANYETVDIVEARDAAAAARGDKFSDFVLAFLSAVFRQAVEDGLVKVNPVLGVTRLYTADESANRRWTPEEWARVRKIAPPNLLPVLMIARHTGARGQDIAVMTWSNYRPDPDLGRAIAFTPRKNASKVGELTIGVTPELQAVLDALKAGDGVVQPASNAPICRNSLGKAYPSENAMRKAWQDFKKSIAFTAALPHSADLTLHGLRVTLASELRESGFTDREVADMLGDLSEGMGKRYARGAEMRQTSIRVHKKRVQNGS